MTYFKAPRPTLIGLTGAARAGKSTVADLIVEKMAPGTATVVTFAAPLKRMVWEMDPLLTLHTNYGCGHLQDIARDLGFTEESAEMWEALKPRTDVRRVLQNTGQAARSAIGSEVWVNVAYEAVDYALQTHDVVVLADLRYTNELQAYADLAELADSLLVRVARPGVVEPGIARHPSEEEWKAFNPDMVLPNCGDLDFLSREVDAMLKGLFA